MWFLLIYILWYFIYLHFCIWITIDIIWLIQYLFDLIHFKFRLFNLVFTLFPSLERVMYSIFTVVVLYYLLLLYKFNHTFRTMTSFHIYTLFIILGVLWWQNDAFTAEYIFHGLSVGVTSVSSIVDTSGQPVFSFPGI